MAIPPPSRAPMAGGFLIAAGVMIGAVAGLMLGEPSAGVVAGFGLGALLALLIWLRERGR